MKAAHIALSIVALAAWATWYRVGQLPTLGSVELPGTSVLLRRMPPAVGLSKAKGQRGYSRYNCLHHNVSRPVVRLIGITFRRPIRQDRKLRRIPAEPRGLRLGATATPPLGDNSTNRRRRRAMLADLKPRRSGISRESLSSFRGCREAPEKAHHHRTTPDLGSHCPVNGCAEHGDYHVA